MTDTDTQGVETHGPALDVEHGLEQLKTADLATQLELQDAADAAADARETLDDAGELSEAASKLEQELTETLGAPSIEAASPEERSQWQQAVMHGIHRAEDFSEEGRFFARIASQLVEIRQATRIAQTVNQHFPGFLQEQRAAGQPELEIEALFDRARACSSAVFSLLHASIRTLEQCDPPGTRGVAATAAPAQAQQTVPASTVRRPQPPANLPAPVVQSAPRSSSHSLDPQSVRERVVAVQHKLEAERRAQASGRAGVAPHVGRVAPRPESVRRKMSGPVDGRAVAGRRDPGTALILASRQLLEDLRRRNRSVERERVTRYCESVVRLHEEGRISERLALFAGEVNLRQNPKNVAKLASFFLQEMKGILPK